MTASVSVTANKFLELSQLYEERDSVLSVVGCAYLIKNKKATQTQKNHCGNPTHEDTVKIAKIYLEGLYGILCEDNECSPKGAGIDFNHILEELVQYFLCKGRHREKDNQANLKKQWSEELSVFKKRCQLRELLKLYLANLNNNPTSVPDGSGLRAPNRDNLTTTPKRAGAELTKSLPSTPLSKPIVDFEPYSQKTPQDQEGDEDIALKQRNRLKNPKTPITGENLAEKTGWVYVIAYPPAKNMFKVGITDYPDQRLKDHQKCYGNSISYRATEKIKSFQLIEKVIFIELDRERRKLRDKCHNCAKRHKEWVNADEGELMEVFNKWVKFARTDPYDETGKLKAGVKLPPPAGNFIYQDTKESRRKSDIGHTKPLERSLLGDFKTKGRSRHSEVGLSRSQLSSQSRSSSDEFDLGAISERFTQLTVKDAHYISDDDT